MAVERGPRYARSGNVHIAYELSGEGPIDLLLVPDGMIPIEAFDEEPSFRRFDQRLASFARVIRYDRRGMGRSDPVTASSPPTLEQWTGDAIAVLDAVGSSRTALLGMAEGGFVAALLAATHPERVSSLVLVNATPGITAEPFRGWGLAADALDRLAGLVEDAWGELEWAIPLFAPSAVGDTRYRDWLVRSIVRSLSPAMASAVFDVLFRSDVRDVLPSINVPTLVVHRRGNRYLTVDHARYLADHIPGAAYAEVEGDDHVPYLGDPGPILDAVEEFLTGARHRPETDRILATIMFTDIVESTETAARLGDRRWREVLLAHYESARGELERFGGRELDTAGDGIFASFDGPAAAVRCAGAIVSAARPFGLELRAGVHTGECHVLAGKLGGIAVHIGSRIAGRAEAGEVLASSTVRDLVAGSGIRFEDRGLQVLKGVPDPWHLYAADPDSLEP